MQTWCRLNSGSRETVQLAGEDKVRDLKQIRLRLMWLAFGVGLIGLAASWLADPEAFSLFRGDLRISTTPQNAEVYLDGDLVGTTPLLISSVPEGDKVIRLTHAYYNDLVETVSVLRGEEQLIDRVFPPAQGNLEVLSNPTGGQVVLNGNPLDQLTPATLTEMPTGTHQVTVSFKHHRDVTRTVDVYPDKTASAVFELPMAPWGTLTINASPSGSRIRLTNPDAVYADGMELAAGEYTVELSKPGFPTLNERVKVGPGANRYSFELKRVEVAVLVTVMPANAEITLEYQLDGLTRERPYSAYTRVPAGRVNVIARASGYRTLRRSITAGNDGARLNLVLERFTVTAGEHFQDSLKSGSKGPELVVVSSGRYQMGDATGEGAADEQPVHEVILTQPFAIGIYEVSQAEFDSYLRATGQATAQIAPETQNLPVVDVDFAAANAYLHWLSEQSGYQYRLPSEAEWEYAARAGSTGSFAHGNDLASLCEFANIADQSTKTRYRTWDVADCTDGFAKIAPVGRLKPNAFGLYDVAGNVSEWVADCWSRNYSRARSDEQPFEDRRGCQRVFRGGSWDSQPETVRVSYRESSDRSNDDRGFRVLREL